MPAPIQAQQTLGIAIAATFGNAEANAEHYLLGKNLYECPQHLLEAEDAAYNTWRHAMATTINAPYGKVGVARAAESTAHRMLRQASKAVENTKVITQRFQEYYDGTYASVSCYRTNPGLYFIYRFFVFRLTKDAMGCCTWTPVGLLNPHAYIGAKRTSRRPNFLDFVDASQPAPVVPAKRLRNGCWLNEWDLPYEEDDNDSLSSCSSEDGEEEEAPAMVMVPLGGGGGGPSEAVYVSATHVPAPPALPPTLSRQNAVTSLSSEAPAAVAPLPLAAGPAMAYPTLERVEGTTDILDSVVLGEKASQLESELKALQAAASWLTAQRFYKLEKAYHGGWTTLPDGRKAMLWAFHAFAPPASPPVADYAKPCSLVHLGLYNPNDRSLDTTEAPPALPKNKADWPW
jgi:hypothetical protein